jgi:hypothetical protein
LEANAMSEIIDNNIQSQLNKSRKDKFLLVLNYPAALKDLATSDLSSRDKKLFVEKSLQFSVFGSVVPEIIVPGITAGYSGQSFKVSSNNREPYADIDVGFTIDNKFNNYYVIYRWLDILNDQKVSYYDARSDTPQNAIANPQKVAPEKYQADLTVYALDEFEKPVMQFTYTKAFPVSLNGISYDYKDPDEITSGFKFSFSQFFAVPL